MNFFLRQSNITLYEVYFGERTVRKYVWSIFIQEAHKYNLQVRLKLLLVCSNECLFINILPENITKWFSSDEQIIIIL